MDILIIFGLIALVIWVVSIVYIAMQYKNACSGNCQQGKKCDCFKSVVNLEQ